MSPHRTLRRRPATFASLIALTATLVAASLGLAACGGSSSTTTTTTQTAANAAATGTTTGGTSTSGTSTGTSSTGTTGTGTSTTGTTSGTSAATRITAVRTCLSKKGITLPQQTAGTGGFPGGGAQLPKGMSRAQFAEALQSCGAGFNGHHFGKRAKGFKNPFNNPRFHAVLARFAACLRQDGIDVGEPNTSGKGPIFDTKGINTGSAQFKAAEAKCRSTLLYALKPSHASPGASATTTTG
jgi:hypothetical protein